MGSGEVLYGELAGLYDRIYEGKPYAQEARELHGIARALGRRGARSLLDVACGTGRHLEELLRWYPDAAGVDASPAMLRIARGRLPGRVPVSRGDMRTFDLGRRFDVVVCLFSAIGYLTTRSDRDRAMARFARHLHPGGVLLVEGWIRPRRFRAPSTHVLTYNGPDVALARISVSRRRGAVSTIAMHYLVVERGKPVRQFREVHRNALVEPAEMLASMRRAGLRASVRFAGRWADRGLFVGVAGARS